MPGLLRFFKVLERPATPLWWEASGPSASMQQCPRKETIKAIYTAAEAQTRISEAVSGISEEMGDVGLAMQRAEDKTAQMQSRAQALDELMASGALEDASLQAGQRDDIQAALEAAKGTGSDIDRELAQLKGQIRAAPSPAQLEAGGDGAATASTEMRSGKEPPS
jgi:phage shock protein A